MALWFYQCLGFLALTRNAEQINRKPLEINGEDEEQAFRLVALTSSSDSEGKCNGLLGGLEDILYLVFARAILRNRTVRHHSRSLIATARQIQHQ